MAPGKGPNGGAKAKNPMKTLGRVFRYMFKYRILMVFVVLFVCITVAANVGGTYLLKSLFSTILEVSDGGAELADLVEKLLLMACLYLCGVAANFGFNCLLINISTGTMRQVRDDMFSHMQCLPVRYFDVRTHGEIMSNYTNDTDTLREMISQGFPQLLSSALTIIGYFAIMLVLSPLLTLVVVVMLGVMLATTGFLGSRGGKFFIRQQKALGKVNGYIEEYVEGQKVVKVFCHEDATKAGFSGCNDELCKAATSANTFANILMPIMGNLGYLMYALVAAIGAVLVINGFMGTMENGIAVMAAFLQCSRQFTMPISQVAQQFNSILLALAGAERVFALMDAEVEENQGYVTLVNGYRDENGDWVETEERTGHWAWKHPHHDGTLTYADLKGDVQFDEVTFGYEPNKTVLKDVSLYAHEGQKIAFVGSTGAGKTTITNLINRFYDVPDGKIRYDGINVNKIKKEDLRRSLGMVLQDTHLFTGTVMDNVRYGRLDATDEECIAAAKLANAHSFITHLPEGYDTMLSGDGANLSQGQRQLLAIARAAVADPPVLILDEATSSIDTRTEKLIEKGMDGLMKGRTVFVIAHRLSTVRNADAIMVLEHGEIIERGNHDALIEKQGKYYQLYTGAFELD